MVKWADPLSPNIIQTYISACNDCTHRNPKQALFDLPDNRCSQNYTVLLIIYYISYKSKSARFGITNPISSEIEMSEQRLFPHLRLCAGATTKMEYLSQILKIMYLMAHGVLWISVGVCAVLVVTFPVKDSRRTHFSSAK